MSAQPKMIYLPDTMANWPWPRAINPHHEEVEAESDAWFEGFKPFTKRLQLALETCDPGMLASLAYPWASKEHLRTGCDLMSVFLIIEESTDVESAPVVRDIVDMVIDAINKPHKPRLEGEHHLGEITRQFWEQSTGNDRHNILTIVMHQFNIDLEAAMAWVASYHKDVENKFLDGMKELPSFGPTVDKELEEYILALAIWLRTNDCWAFESGRYFWSKGLQVQKTRYVPVLPKVKTQTRAGSLPTVPGSRRDRP
ncbi:hypothetical protein POSPLADRAFT_1134967 [Postia placenta MAD-698-R-SB12]|uniref:Terpene synthase n=1 Tax=Postia placenta MAD-698-R-SB12 TaxID=670580 RepID=A0A1X6N7V7_9APHY|nr:hypothetical protein POSPLADRAFT_1134967 [Postia placenta MAD-698-R-SB12]OSX64664.1 hypothetical protein POSPLADRAFT_1134967 [Postia placenta MAD-698-R-SB12]